jgi:thymidylate synthase (FAD)
MKVSLISATESRLPSVYMSPEDLIVYIARVSNPANQLNTETSDKLIAYLIKNKHWSPMEMVDMTVEIITSRCIAQQILRHRSFSFQEFSQRYSEVTDFEDIELRMQADKNRQSSISRVPSILNESMQGRIKQCLDDQQELYSDMLKIGIAKECARFVLPLSTQTKIYMKGSVRSWIHYLQIRCDEHTQLEHQQIALSIKELFIGQFPMIAKALEW